MKRDKKLNTQNLGGTHFILYIIFEIILMFLYWNVEHKTSDK